MISSVTAEEQMEVSSNGPADPGEWNGEQPDIHPMIASAFRALDGLGPWVLLRGEDDLVRPAGDVDVLVGDGHIQHLDKVLEGVGFRRLLAPGHGSHRFYFCYDSAADLWLKLDIVSEISFGPYQQWPTPLARGCLKRRIRNGLLWLPATTEQAWLQLLHTMLDKGGRVRPDRLDTVRIAGTLASTNDAVAAYVDRQVGPGTAAQLLELARSGSVEDLPGPALRMAAALTGNAPLRSRLLAGRNRASRLIGPTFRGRFGRGIVVGVVGPEGEAKAALLRGLREAFPLPGRHVHVGGNEPGRWDGWLGRVPGGRLGPEMIRRLRGAVAARYHCRRGRLVLMDGPAYESSLRRFAGPAAGGWRRGSWAPRPDVLLELDSPGRAVPGARRLRNRWVLDSAQPQPALRRLAAGIVWAQVTGSAPPQAASGGSATLDGSVGEQA